MNFDTSQMRQIVGLSKDALRHWKKVLEPIAKRDGRTARYTFQEVFALSIINVAVDELGISVAKFEDVAGRLFADAAEQVDTGAVAKDFYITKGLMQFGDAPPDKMNAAVAVISGQAVLERIQEKVRLDDDVMGTQLRLPFHSN